MSVAAKVLAHSVSSQGIELVSFEVVTHRFILPEVNTHRAFSRNWASSRAIPTAKLIEMVRINSAMPVHWGKNQPGMQAAEELTGKALLDAKLFWREAAGQAAIAAEAMLAAGVHKQVVNRVLEPFLWVRGVITATDWANFYALRRHPDAQPEIKVLADAMWEAKQASTPRRLNPGEWHTPYVSFDDYYWLGLEAALKVSAARCARASYKTHDGRVSTVEEDLALCDRLKRADVLHASPFEHQATPDTQQSNSYSGDAEWVRPELHGNLRGWRQQRKTMPNETAKEVV